MSVSVVRHQSGNWNHSITLCVSRETYCTEHRPHPTMHSVVYQLRNPAPFSYPLPRNGLVRVNRPNQVQIPVNMNTRSGLL